MSSPNILIVTPTLARTGSEIALANFLNHANFDNIRIGVYAVSGDCALAEELSPEIQMFRIPFIRWFRGSPLFSYINRFVISGIYLRWLIFRHKPRLIYVNTISLPKVIALAKEKKIAAVLHMHELEHMLALLSPVQLDMMLDYPAEIICCSNRVFSVLKTLGRVSRITTIYSSSGERREKIDIEIGAQLRKQLGIHEDAIIWIMAGTLDANKNPVRFVEIARRYLAERPGDHFLWVGDGGNGYAIYARRFAEAKISGNRVHWIKAENQKQYVNLFGLANGVVITSDYESLSLVAIEALEMGKPVIAFKNGGTQEILGEKSPFLMNAFDIDRCVKTMITLARKISMGQKPIRMPRIDKFSAKSQSLAWNKLMNKILNLSSG